LYKIKIIGECKSEWGGQPRLFYKELNIILCAGLLDFIFDPARVSGTTSRYFATRRDFQISV
jgi:hypothetical protein